MYAAAGIYVVKGGSVQAAYFSNGNYYASLGGASGAADFANSSTGVQTVLVGSGGEAGYFFDGIRTALIANGTFAGKFLSGGSEEIVFCNTAGFAGEALGHFDISSGNYYHNGVAGLTEAGHSGGILTTRSGLDAAIESKVLDLAAGGFI
jgi:hypothetical protein